MSVFFIQKNLARQAVIITSILACLLLSTNVYAQFSSRIIPNRGSCQTAGKVMALVDTGGGVLAWDCVSGGITVGGSISGGTDKCVLFDDGALLGCDATNFQYNKTTHVLSGLAGVTATTFTGALSGNASTASTASTLSAILALALGGTHADLSGTGGTHQVLRQSTVGANVTVSQLACADLSDGATGCSATALPPNGAAGGDLSGSYPNPTVAKVNGNAPTTAAVSHKWVSALDSSARGTLTQPDFTDLTGTATVAQGGTGTTTTGDDKVVVGDSSTASTARSLPTSPQNGPAVTQSVLYDSNANTFSGAENLPDPSLNSRISMQMASTIGSTTFLGVGEGNATSLGTSSVFAADTTTFNRMYISATTKSATPASGDEAGWSGGANGTKTNYSPRLSAKIATSATITSQRIWVALSDAAVITTSTSSTNAALRLAGFGYDTGVSGNWYFCTAIGTGAAASMSCDDTGVVVATSTEYTMVIDEGSLSTIYWRINSTSGGKSTNMPATGVAQRWYVDMATLTTAQRAFSMHTLTLRQN